MAAKTQQDLVNERAINSDHGQEITDEVRLPNVQILHSRPREEIADVLINLLKSRANVTEIRWRIGEEFIEVSYISP